VTAGVRIADCSRHAARNEAEQAVCFRASMDGLVLAHDYLLVQRGAERTFAAMADIWPTAPIVTLLYDEGGTGGHFAGRSITTSPLQRLGLTQHNFRAGLPLYSTAVRRLDTSRARALLSSSSAFAHGIRKPPGVVHVCYCHTPFRYAWHERETALREVPGPLRPVLSLLLRRHRGFDRRAVGQVDRFLANSLFTRDRIRRYWGRDATVVYPPVDVERFSPGEPADYVLFVGELVRHKRPEAAIEAAMSAGRRIKVVGGGRALAALRNRYRGRAEFLGRVTDEALARLYAEAAALVVPGVEEFGIAGVEAQASGRPVIAIDAGGARETVVPGRTGLLVANSGSSALARALREDFTAFDPEDIRAHAQRFSRQVFQERMREIVEETCGRAAEDAAALT
jgi:glycosyltransferase involved in cell wall biosynthesis